MYVKRNIYSKYIRQYIGGCRSERIWYPGGVSSIEIDPGAHYLVVLFNKINYEGEAQVITQKYSSEIRLNDDVSSVMVIKVK